MSVCPTDPYSSPGPEVYTELGFDPLPEMVVAVRHYVNDVLIGWGLESVVGVAVLATSEVVTNAIIHAGTRVHVILRHVVGVRLLVGVEDESARMARLIEAAPGDDHGRGLVIVDAVTNGWWVDRHSLRGKTVWFEIGTAA